MKQKKTIRREALAKRLEGWAKRLRAGKPIRVGTTTAYVPERVIVEAEFETIKGESELEIEIKWPALAKGGASSKQTSKARPRKSPQRHTAAPKAKRGTAKRAAR